MKNCSAKTVVKIECGDRIGTAFFVSENLLLTARHNVIENITNKEDSSIDIIIDNKKNIAEIKYFPTKVETGDFCILRINDHINPEFLESLTMPIRRHDKYTFFGYPLTILGQVSGTMVGIEIHSKEDTIHKIEGFDSTAAIIGSFMPTEFTGFSGSPIFDDLGMVVGIVTHKLDGCIGFISINAIKDDLINNGIICNTDYERYDKSPYSKLTNRKILEKSINIAGPRYMRDIHVDKNSLDKYFEYAINVTETKDKIEKYSQSIKDIHNVLNTTTLPVFLCDGTDCKANLLQELNSHKNGEINYYLNTLIENINANFNDLKGKSWDKSEKPNINTWNTFYSLHNAVSSEIGEYYPLINAPYLCIVGKAGSGKTHLLCHKAEEFINLTNVYLCFGNQFVGDKEIEEQVKSFFEFGSSNFLEELNEKGNDSRSIIMIDAINEGIGYIFWKEKLPAFFTEIKKYSNICLIISVRDPFLKSLELNEEFKRIEHIGYDDIEKAKNNYFAHYKINNEDISFNTPEFRNPLFLKVFCETFSSLNNYEKNKINKLSYLFISYVRKKEILISEKIDYDNHLRPVSNFIKAISLKSIQPTQEEFMLQDISRYDAHIIGDNICPNRKWSESLLYWILEEGLVISSIRYGHMYDQNDRIDFAYERMGDIFKAISFLNLTKNKRTILLNKYLKINTAQTYNFFVALSSIISDWDDCQKEIFDIYPFQFKNSSIMKKAFMESLNYRVIESSKIIDILNKYVFRKIDDKIFFESFFYDVYSENCKLNAEYLHKILISLDLTELNIRWTHTVNVLYDERKLDLFYSIDKINDIQGKTANEKYNYLIFLCWLLSSSYPVVRDRVTRIITYILKNNEEFTINIINRFKDVKDLYILERLICAVYGVILICDNKEYIRNIAQTILAIIFKDKNPPLHIQLRHFARLIVERAYYLKLITEEEFEQCLPPYKSNLDISEINSEEIINLWKSNGSKALLHSIGITNNYGLKSDFSRYTLGGNSRVNSVFSTVPLSMPPVIGDDQMYTINQIEKIICDEIRILGWSEELGKLDNGFISRDRHENKKERIGKKYQWLALYSLIAKLSDNNYCRDDWNDNIVVYKSPFDIGYGDYFDPSIEILELTYKAIIPETELNIIKQDFNPQESFEDWMSSNNDTLKVENFIISDNKGSKWVRLSGIDVWKVDDNPKKELFYRYDSYFIDGNKLSEFTTWAEGKIFYGRWMPEIRDLIDFRLHEYMWCSTYRKLKINNEVLPNNGSPCNVIVTTITHLQEDFRGFESEDEYKHTTALPCEELMEKMRLKLSPQRGFILDENSQLSIFDSTYLNIDANGLYIRKDLLDSYLQKNGKELVMCVLGGKEVISNMITNKEISGYFQYDKDSGYIGTVKM